MSRFLTDPRLAHVTSRDGRAARDYLIEWTGERGWRLSCGGTVVPHIQFRRHADERPYPYSLILNPVTPTFYVRRPSSVQRQAIPRQYAGAHLNAAREVKIPVPDLKTAKRIADEFLN